MEFINYLPNMADMVSLFSILGAVICASGALGVLYGKVERDNHEISALLFAMVATSHVEEAFEKTEESVDPEVIFFGELLPEEEEIEPIEFVTAIQRVAKMNRAGRLYDPSNGRFIARGDLHSWVVPADLITQVLEDGAFPAPSLRILS